MKIEVSQYFMDKVKEAHELMIASVSKIEHRENGIGNRDDKRESAVIDRWCDSEALVQDLGTK